VFSLMRNIGSSIGISGVVALLSRNTQILHARLAEQVTPFGDGLAAAAGAGAPDGGGWLAGLNAEVSRQAAMLAYNNDFQLMLVLSLLAIPLVLVLRPAKRAAGSLPSVAE
jgi:MFS transporter, DHA2 family, multidrug resistance protein